MARTPVPNLANVDPTTISFEVATRDVERPSDRLRYEARALYVMHPDGVTLDELVKDARFEGKVSLTTMKRWASDDGWVAEREKVLAQFGAKLRSGLQKELYSRMAGVRLKQLEVVDKLRERMLSEALSTDAKSGEGAAKATLDVMKYEMELSSSLAQELVPQGAGGGSTIDPRSAVTDEEVLEAAQIVLRERRRRAMPVIDTKAVEVQPKALPAPTEAENGA
jgi:hypothetical protein